MDNFYIRGIVSTYLYQLKISYSTLQTLPNTPGANAPGTTSPGLITPFTNAPYHIKSWRRLRQALIQHDRCRRKKALGKKDTQPKTLEAQPLQPPRKQSTLETVFTKLNAFGLSVRRQVLAKKACHQ